MRLSMIEELRIRGIGVIDQAAVTLSPGLTVLTGETGAGKTMILTGLELLMGGKADSGLVRQGLSQAEVDAQLLIAIEGAPELVQMLDEWGAHWDDSEAPGSLTCSRVVLDSGRSKALVGGRPVPVGSLGTVMHSLVRVHGQSDQVRLREESAQRDLVDRMGGAAVRDARAHFTEARDAWLEARRALERLRHDRDEIRRQGAVLAAAVEEIDKVNPTIGEEVELEQLARTLQHIGELREGSEGAREALIGSEDSAEGSALAAVVRAEQQVQSLTALEPLAASWAQRLGALRTEIIDMADDLGTYTRTLNADPERQQWVEARRAQLTSLMKKYGTSISDVLDWAAQARHTVAVADDLDGALERAEAEEARTRAGVVAAASALTESRTLAAARLADAVHAELAELAMPHAALHISVVPETEPANFAAHGADAVVIELQAHPGAPSRPLGKAASGGELSRIALAMEVVLAQEDPVATMVFDEVDAGIGGTVAVEVGRRLARLARSTQVVVVTHLPQVAAFAHEHVVVAKSTDGTVTHSTLTRVTGEARVKELVRMLAGLADSESGQAHAEELLALAQSEM